ncbi:uncharacterized protein [Dermacentor andersoni]|uniref:uncharacterized protein isoform X2 n=1 Tax=Dermacentor andersoni TaxID=34620 RepID=UPI0024162725|nr:uncharacterized protein LOC129382698 isoform X2 [Dermacentor andersoni]
MVDRSFRDLTAESRVHEMSGKPDFICVPTALVALLFTASLHQWEEATACPLEQMLTVQTFCEGLGSKCLCDYECCGALTCGDNQCVDNTKFKPEKKAPLKLDADQLLYRRMQTLFKAWINLTNEK